MEAFHWDRCFVTGLERIDAQHRHLVEVLNRFGELTTRETAVSSADLEALVDELSAYAVDHFREEEALMARLAVDARHRAPHTTAHTGFVEEVLRLRAGLLLGQPEVPRYLLGFLTQWLAYHILGQDLALARQVVAIQAGQPPAAAFEALAATQDPATATLVAAVNGLFEQLSERNRELHRLNQTLEARVAERTRELQALNQRLEALALTDALTGLPNRRHALVHLEREWARSAQQGTPLVCMMVDADGFKQVNDAHGHAAGDLVLRELARCLAYSVRTDDAVCRMGGDEFLIVCARTPLDGARALAEAVRARVAELRVPAGSGTWPGSVSVGVAERTPGMASVNDLLRVADEGVYLAKQRGRNRVATAQRPAA